MFRIPSPTADTPGLEGGDPSLARHMLMRTRSVTHGFIPPVPGVSTQKFGPGRPINTEGPWTVDDRRNPQP